MAMFDKYLRRLDTVEEQRRKENPPEPLPVVSVTNFRTLFHDINGYIRACLRRDGGIAIVRRRLVRPPTRAPEQLPPPAPDPEPPEFAAAMDELQRLHAKERAQREQDPHGHRRMTLQQLYVRSRAHMPLDERRDLEVVLNQRIHEAQQRTSTGTIVAETFDGGLTDRRWH